MSDDLSVAMERLRTSTQRLNAICDAAAQTVRDTEVFLEEMQVGVSAYVSIRQEWDDKENSSRAYLLGYEKYNQGKFRIVVAEVYDPEDGEDEMTFRPWAESRRDEKLESFEKLPDLLVELAKQVEARVSKAEATVTEVSARLPLPKKRKGADK